MSETVRTGAFRGPCAMPGCRNVAAVTFYKTLRAYICQSCTSTLMQTAAEADQITYDPKGWLSNQATGASDHVTMAQSLDTLPSGLTLRENELLTLLSEQCGRLVQEIARSQRIGLDMLHERAAVPTQRERIAAAVGNLLAALDMSVQAGVLAEAALEAAQTADQPRLIRRLRHPL